MALSLHEQPDALDHVDDDRMRAGNWAVWRRGSGFATGLGAGGVDGAYVRGDHLGTVTIGGQVRHIHSGAYVWVTRNEPPKWGDVVLVSCSSGKAEVGILDPYEGGSLVGQDGVKVCCSVGEELAQNITGVVFAVKNVRRVR